MKKEQFLKDLRHSLKKFNDDEVREIIGYYDEMISDKIEMGQSEDSIIASLGHMKDISKEVQLELINSRVNTTNSLEKTSKSFFILLALLLSPALFPIAIVLFVAFFTIIITSASLMLGFGAASIGLIVGLIPYSILIAHSIGTAGAILSAGIILILAAIFGVLTIIFYQLTKEILNIIMKQAIKLTKKAKGRNK